MDHAATLDVALFRRSCLLRCPGAGARAGHRPHRHAACAGQLIQQVVTLLSLSAGVFVYSPWLFVALVACITPAFLGESHFAFLGYSLAHSLTPVRRELDYLRVLATSKESAKEVKIFGLARYLRERFADITDGLIERNRRLARKRLWGGALLSLVGSLGYYGGYAYLVIHALQGQLTVGSLTFLAGALAALQQRRFRRSSPPSLRIADQSLFLTDLLHFFAVRPRIHLGAGRVARAAAHPRRL